MQIVVFGAYKGGVGRTYAAVSIANALARCGLNVVVVDLDVDAPSVPTLYGTSVWAADGADDRGLVPWVVGGKAEPLASHVVSLYSDVGSLRILPAGPLGPDYLDSLVADEWRDAFELNADAFAQDLIEQLAGLSPAPDVLLFDARAGLGPILGALLTVEHATVAFLFAGDTDSARVAEGLRQQSQGSARRVLPVLSRYPTFMPEMPRVLKLLERYVKDLADLPFLPASPGHEGSERPTIGLDFVDRSSQLAVDHVRLLLNLFDEAPPVPPANDRELSALFDDARSQTLDPPATDPELAELFEEARTSPKINYKIFRDLAKGRMVNPADGSPNVAFKVSTIQSVFEQIRVRVHEFGMPEQQLDEALREGGRRAGKEFGSHMAEALADETPAERLAAWCTFDSEVGFGRMEPLPADGNHFEVRIVDPFLPQGSGSSKILEGYALGVLEHLLGAAVTAHTRWDGPNLMIDIELGDLSNG